MPVATTAMRRALKGDFKTGSILVSGNFDLVDNIGDLPAVVKHGLFRFVLPQKQNRLHLATRNAILARI